MQNSKKRRKVEVQGDDVVQYSEGATLNLGDYTSRRIDFGITRKVSKNDPESDLQALIEFVHSTLDDMISEALKD